MDLQRNEYPRPTFVRQEWTGLNGEWDFVFDDQDQGLTQNWPNNPQVFSKKIIVPFPFQSKLSGIGDKSSHPIIWYRRTFQISKEWSGKRVIINFGAIDYEASLWLNGKYLGSNQGGYVPFSFDITDFLIANENQLVIRVIDNENPNHPRGKQSARIEPWECWYTRVSGIWQSVWLEPVSKVHLKNLKLQPDIDREKLLVRYALSTYAAGITLRFKISYQGQLVAEKEVPVTAEFTRYSDIEPIGQQALEMEIAAPRLWSPEEPNLYDLDTEVVVDNRVIDAVRTYFGMRKISVEQGKIYLNNHPYYLRMVLDQGLWPEGIYTPGSVAEFKQDVELTKAMGFNGARKHQKIEDPYYYYYCDKMGLLVWSELPSSYRFDENMVNTSLSEWQRAIERDFNHPSIIAWVPVNESWGVEPLHRPLTNEYQKAVSYLETIYHLTKTLDNTRLVISNDGWQQATTDIISIHEYTQDGAELIQNYQKFKADRHSKEFQHQFPTILPEYSYEGQPIMITEFGGVKVDEQTVAGWGYGESELTYKGMAKRIKKLVCAILGETEICGYCYTQLTDTEQEVNGLLTANRVPKLATNKLAEIFSERRGSAD